MPPPHSLTTALAALTALGACAAPRPAEIPRADRSLVVIKAVRIPTSEPWYSRFADHTWIDMHTAGEADWTRVEANLDPAVWQVPAAAAHEPERWGRAVELVALWQGPEAAALIPKIEERASEVADGFCYRAWPGPNSNTFVARILEGVPELAAELPHNAVGKDYTAWLDAGWTTAADGLYLDSLPLGFSLGWKSGVELHLLGLTAGLAFWPPALKLPILPRLGFEPGSTQVP